jgi:hypothetical protein
MAVETDIELGEVAVILGAVIFIGYVIYKASGSVGNALSSVGTAISNGASSALSAVRGVAPVQNLPVTAGGVKIRGTDYTVADLTALGWTADDISQFMAQQGGLTMTAPTGAVMGCTCGACGSCYNPISIG